MGLNWIIEGILMMIPMDQTASEYEIISHCLDMGNALMGVFIFGLFVLKPSVLRLIKKRFVSWNLVWNSNHFLTTYSSSFRWHSCFGNSSPNGSITSYASWIPPEHFVTAVKQRWTSKFDFAHQCCFIVLIYRWELCKQGKVYDTSIIDMSLL